MPSKNDDLSAERGTALKAHVCQYLYDNKADVIAPLAQAARLAEKGEETEYACFKGLKSTNINSRFLAMLENFARQPPAVTIIKKTKDGEASAPSTPSKKGGRTASTSASVSGTPKSASKIKAEKVGNTPRKRQKMIETESEEECNTSESESDWSATNEDGSGGRKRKIPAKGVKKEGGGGAKVKAERI